MARQSDPIDPPFSPKRTYSITPQAGNVTLIINLGGTNNAQGGSGAELNSLTLPITPEDIQISRPSRQAVTQTLTSAYQDHLGSGIATVTMRGHTGWRNLTVEGDGYVVIKKLRDLLGQYDKSVATDRPSGVSMMLLLNLPSGWEHFRVSKSAVTYTRSRAQPLLYRYEVQFIVLHDFNDPTGQVDPSPNFVIQPGIFPDVVLNALPDSTTGDDGDPATIIGGQVKHDPRQQLEPGPSTTPDPKDPRQRLEPGPTIPGSTSPTDGPMTLQQFTDQQYPPALGYPPGMFNYIIAANPDFCIGDVDPNTYLMVPGTTLNILQISSVDVAHYTHRRGYVTSQDVYSINGTIIIDGQIHSFPIKRITIPNEGEYRGWDTTDTPGNARPDA